MGYTIYLEIDTGAGHTAQCGDIGGYTYNVSRMFQNALGQSLTAFNQMNAGESVELLLKGVNDMEAYPAFYRAMNPDNGWGDYEGALDYLRSLLRACQDHPLARIVVT